MTDETVESRVEQWVDRLYAAITAPKVETMREALRPVVRDLLAAPAALGWQEGESMNAPIDDLEHWLSSALNRFSAENASNTPDFILAQFLLGCLAAWNTGVQQRETWYGRDARPGSIVSAVVPAPPGAASQERSDG